MALDRQAAGALLALALASAGCASVKPRGPSPEDLARFDLQARLAARAASLIGRTGGFREGNDRFPADCSGFVEAVYQAEGIPLRDLMHRAAPEARSGVSAAYLAARAYGVEVPPDEWPAPGDLVFWHDTYDRNRNGRADDGLTHVGIVEYVADGTVVFIHRGAHAVTRGAMDPRRPHESTVNGFLVNSPIRKRSGRLEGVPVLAGELFAGYGRIDPEKARQAIDLATR